MSKKHHAGKKRVIENKEEFDFSSLLSYCSEEEKEKFTRGLSSSPVSGLLLNEELCSKEEFKTLFPELMEDEKDPLLFRFDKKEESLGKTLEHFGGYFYILDPSSALISSYLEKLLKKDFISFDLCAAPGGKTIALDLRRKDGYYLANDLSFDRAQEIDKNVQRLRKTNILSLSIDPMKLNLPNLFDLVIADVPCSGSGMIRKEKKMMKDWSMEKVERLLPIQKNLIEKAYEMAKGNGIIAYSTCSLSIEEDECQIEDFLSRHKDCSLIDIDLRDGMVKGKNNLGYHMIPGIYSGEGIYFALIRKGGKEENHLTPYHSQEEPIEFSYHKNTYIVSKMYEEFLSLPYVAPGIRKYDFSEHPKCEFDHSYSKVCQEIPLLEVTKEQALSYIAGNEIKSEEKEGLVVLDYQNMRLGFGKIQNGKVKNYLPKGLRGNLLA